MTMSTVITCRSILAVFDLTSRYSTLMVARATRLGYYQQHLTTNRIKLLLINPSIVLLITLITRLAVLVDFICHLDTVLYTCTFTI